MISTTKAAEILALLDGAQMIGARAPRGQAICLRHAERLQQGCDQVVRAHMLATAHGIFEVEVNGDSPDGSLLNPGWTSYEWRLMVRDVDVTEQVCKDGETLCLEVLLGNGWWRGAWGFGNQQSDYGDELGFIAALEIEYADGTTQVVRTTSAWEACGSCVVENSLYNGQTIDARLRGNEPRLETVAAEFDRSTLELTEAPQVKRFETFRPVRIWTSPSGKTLVDFGQNLVGWIRFTVCGERGDAIVLRHAEVIESGELGVRPLRAAKNTDTFICSGGRDFFEPTLTQHGFRYAEVTGWPGELAMADLEAVAIRSDIRRTGWFTCSHAGLNQLVENSTWSQRGNFVDLPTDCPQRDEREGWTGDISVYSPTATFQYDCSEFLHKWLLDLKAEAEHAPSGVVPMVVPDIIKFNPPWDVVPWTKNETAIWGDAAVWVPWALWRAYGDKTALESHYPGMCLHLRMAEDALSSEDLWDSGFQFGDWLDPTAPPDDPAAAKANCYVIAQACLYRSASCAAEAAVILGRADDAKHWHELAARVRRAFNRAYVSDGRVASDATAAYALALHFGLLDDDDRSKAAARLAELVRDAGYRVTTGFAGTPYITWALSENGYVDDAYRLLLEEGCPSWLYPVTMGATTTWERWDSMLPSGLINPGGMTSFNHYALGAVCDWVYQVVGGIRAEEPGYARVRIEPVPGPGITWAQCSFDSVHGRIESRWKLDGELFTLEVRIPEGVSAIIVLPDGSSFEAACGDHHFGCLVRAE